VKLKEAQTMPAMISLKTEGGERTNVDLICVIDVSGSMSGEKIALVKSTMKYLLDALTPADRLSIITFENFG
jgi:Mg-chelatase subunit ChlD